MAKQSAVKCPYCDCYFYREEEEFVKIGRRYAHKTCVDVQGQDDILKERIREKAKSVLGTAYVKTRVDKQINEFVEDGKTLEGILYTLEYWYDIKKMSAEKAYGGIGIVPFIYQEAQEYKSRQDQIKQITSGVVLSDCVIPADETILIKPTPIRRPKRLKLFELH